MDRTMGLRVLGGIAELVYITYAALSCIPNIPQRQSSWSLNTCSIRLIEFNGIRLLMYDELVFSTKYIEFECFEETYLPT